MEHNHLAIFNVPGTLEDCGIMTIQAMLGFHCSEEQCSAFVQRAFGPHRDSFNLLTLRNPRKPW